MPTLAELKGELEDEVSIILASDFEIEVTKTTTVPHSNDAGITYPNLDSRTQKAKLIDTCVLYIDIRRSTEMNLAHRPQTVTKLYSAFVRAMTRVARHHQGHVRGIIGDRVMVLFDKENAFVQAVECAISMNTVAKHIINKHFKAGEFTCGIGIDTGRMLAAKTGIRRNGQERVNYRNLVWLGRPANVASKLTDIANKPSESVTVPEVLEGFPQRMMGLAAPSATNYRWVRLSPIEFLRKLRTAYFPTRIVHEDPNFTSFYLTDKSVEIRAATPPILMTLPVWTGFAAARPNDLTVTSGWFSRIGTAVPGYTGGVIGGDVIFTHLRA